MFARLAPVALVRTLVLILLAGLAACTGSPATLAIRPDFEMLTPAGLASVSIRQSPPEMTDAEFTRLVITGMTRAAPDSVIACCSQRAFPAQRIVWHVDLTAARGVSRLVVNVFDGARPYAYEQEVVSNDTPSAAIASVVQSMSKRLLADVATHANMPARPIASIPQLLAAAVPGTARTGDADIKTAHVDLTKMNFDHANVRVICCGRRPIEAP